MKTINTREENALQYRVEEKLTKCVCNNSSTCTLLEQLDVVSCLSLDTDKIEHFDNKMSLVPYLIII